VVLVPVNRASNNDKRQSPTWCPKTVVVAQAKFTQDRRIPGGLGASQILLETRIEDDVFSLSVTEPRTEHQHEVKRRKWKC